MKTAIAVLLWAGIALAQALPSSPASKEPKEVTLCQLSRDPTEGEKKQRKQTVEVEGIRVTLVDDAPLKRFVALLKQKPHIAKASLVGVFFAGERQTANGKPTLPGSRTSDAHLPASQTE